MPSALSIDHEFLTRQGWKRLVTTEDELVVFSYPFEYLRPKRVEINPYEAEMIFFENEQLNVFATPDLELLGGGTLNDLVEGKAFEVCLVSPHAAGDASPVVYRGHCEGAESCLLSALSSGRHATMRKSSNFAINREYIVQTFTTNTVADPGDKWAHLIHMECSKGSSVISIEMPKKVAICTRRHGKPCWVYAAP